MVTPALGTPSSGTVTNLTGTASININGTVGATTPAAGAFTTLSATGITTVAAGSAALPAIVSTTGTADTGFWFPAADTIAASTAGTERMRIDSAGNVGIGGTPTSFQKIVVAGTFPSASASTRGIDITGTIPSATTSGAFGVSTLLDTQAAAFTLADMTHFRAGQGTIGATSAVTNQYGFNASSSLTGATNNYGFYGNIASGTGRWNFYAAGTAENYFAGNVGIGSNVITANLDINTANATFRIRNASAGNDFSIKTVAGPITQAGSVSNTDLAFITNDVERMRVSSTGVVTMGSTPGASSLRVTPVASAVNYWALNGNVTGSAPALLVNGSDTNISAFHITKGTGNFGFYTGTTSGLTGAVQQFNIAHTSSAVNYLQVTGGATGNAATLSAAGSDTNIDIALTPKGTGVLKFGTYTAGILAQAGYITIKDAAGNTRNLLVG